MRVPVVECISKARPNALRVRKHCHDLEGRPDGGHAEHAGQSTRRPHAGRDSRTSEHTLPSASPPRRSWTRATRTHKSKGRTSCARARSGASPERSGRRFIGAVPSEPATEHKKMDGRFGCDPLKSDLDDALHAVICGAGHKLRLILGKLRLLCASLAYLLGRYRLR